MSSEIKLLALTQVDRRLPQLRKGADEINGQTPHMGWIKGLRTALGMSERAFAKRLGVTYGAIQKLEQNERSGSITLDTLRRAANALDADVVYAIVPRQPLRKMIAARARELATSRVGPIAHSMALEDQKITVQQIARRIEELASELEKNPRDLWR